MRLTVLDFLVAGGHRTPAKSGAVDSDGVEASDGCPSARAACPNPMSNIGTRGAGTRVDFRHAVPMAPMPHAAVRDCSAVYCPQAQIIARAAEQIVGANSS